MIVSYLLSIVYSNLSLSALCDLLHQHTLSYSPLNNPDKVRCLSLFFLLLSFAITCYRRTFVTLGSFYVCCSVDCVLCFVPLLCADVLRNMIHLLYFCILSYCM